MGSLFALIDTDCSNSIDVSELTRVARITPRNPLDCKSALHRPPGPLYKVHSALFAIVSRTLEEGASYQNAILLVTGLGFRWFRISVGGGILYQGFW